MGDRANYIWKENDKITGFYSGHGAHDTILVLAQGLEYCRDFFPKLSVDSDEINLYWALGVLMIDVDKKHIIVFSCDDYPPQGKRIIISFLY